MAVAGVCPGIDVWHSCTVVQCKVCEISLSSIEYDLVLYLLFSGYGRVTVVLRIVFCHGIKTVSVVCSYGNGHKDIPARVTEKRPATNSKVTVSQAARHGHGTACTTGNRQLARQPPPPPPPPPPPSRDFLY